jgi:hypothetical protein
VQRSVGGRLVRQHEGGRESIHHTSIIENPSPAPMIASCLKARYIHASSEEMQMHSLPVFLCIRLRVATVAWKRLALYRLPAKEDCFQSRPGDLLQVGKLQRGSVQRGTDWLEMRTCQCQYKLERTGRNGRVGGESVHGCVGVSS